ncbi:hypothetical protein O181_126480 [Austropuccinia psidii MF-1]|uniref:Uncharacterized protein n=1 Tax=Austropuccinia psidii MF-1 TaxID=1389203 RepID=A0A9Q3KWP0_9BASI|nr:hypothetical protein [Austropuccinia psidii MF-1]
MDLDQDIPVMNPKGKIVSPEERHKWKMPELPPVLKGEPAPLTLLLSPEADITAIPVVTPESFQTGNNTNIPVSIQELIYGIKVAGVGTSSNSLDRQNELISSSKEVHGPRKDRGSSEGLDIHVLQRTSPKDKSLVEKPKHVVRGPEEEFGPRKGKQPSGSSPSLQK